MPYFRGSRWSRSRRRAYGRRYRRATYARRYSGARRDRRFPLGRTVGGVPGYALKTFLLEQTAMALTTAGGSTICTNISAGTTMATRNSDNIFVHDVTLRAEVHHVSGAAATAQDSYRFLLIRWLPDSSADTPTSDSILESRATQLVSSAYQQATADRAKFQVLADVTGSITNDTSNAFRVHTRTVRVRAPIVFDAGSNAGSGHLYIITVGSSTAGADQVQMRITINTRFSDLH